MARAAILFSLLILGLTHQGFSSDVAVEVAADGGAAVEVAVDVKAEHFNKTEVCVLEEDVGPCKEVHQRFFYNSTTHSCEEFTYGGCQGNQNNFESHKDCMDKCHTEAEDDDAHGADAATAAPQPDAHGADAASVAVETHDADASVIVSTGGSDSASVKIDTPSTKVEVEAQS